MFKKTLITLGCLVALGSAVAKEVTIPTARGDVTVDAPPAKIAVYDTASIDTLHELGVKINGIPQHAIRVLPQAKSTFDNADVNVGTVFAPDLEALNALKPDLIIVGKRTARHFDALSGIAKTIDLTDNGDTLIADSLNRYIVYGEIFGKQEQASKLRAEIEGLIKETQQAVKGKGNGLIIITNGGKISAFGSGYRLSWIHDILGVPMADDSIKVAGHGKPVSFEFIQKLNPDWLFVMDRIAAIGQEGQSAKEVLDNELVHQTNAWKNGNIVYLSGASYISPGGFDQLKTDLTTIKQAFEKK
ncbi:enterochelin ABC transporter substrate-binding protein [Pasteurellaceae bacterium LFhippo2]|nr:enterochelin ABC transporter substrate-binding protein [Pasteurellaceae bacterium LFhippo2]